MSGASPAEAATSTFTADADAYVVSTNKKKNFGSTPTLRIDGEPTTRAYLRFAVSLPAGAIVTRTTLGVDFTSASASGYSATVAVGSNWGENTITYANAPGFGPAVANDPSVTTGLNWLDVPHVSPNTSITYVLSRSQSDTLTARSRETASKPRLVVEYGFLESTTLETDTSSWATTISDFNVDGLDDFLVTRHGSIPGGDPISLQQPGGGFAHGHFFPRGKDRHGCAAGDVSGDGRPDLYCMLGADLGTGEKENELWIARSDGNYLDQAGLWGVTDPFGRGRRPILFDFNGDGRLDLYATNLYPREDNERSENILYLNAGVRFSELPVTATGPHGAACVDVGDWNGDGRKDLLVCGPKLHLFQNANGLSTQLEDGLLGAAQVNFPRDATMADMNKDGLDDLVLVTAKELQIRLNLGAGARFSVVHHRLQLVNGNSVAVGDLTADGVRDVYVVESDSNGVNVDDLFLAGPGWEPLRVPPADGAGHQAEFIAVGGQAKVLVTNGSQTRGPIQLIGLRP